MEEWGDRLFELLNQMRLEEVEKSERENRPYYVHGLCAILGYDASKHNNYFDTDSGKKDIFAGQNLYLHQPRALEALREAMEIDGAILIRADGKILHSGSYMQHDDSVYQRHPEANSTRLYLRDRFDGGTRHRAAIALSAQLPELFFYTLKSDHPQLRVFRSGSIYLSTVPEEAREVKDAKYGPLFYQPEILIG